MLTLNLDVFDHESTGLHWLLFIDQSFAWTLILIVLEKNFLAVAICFVQFFNPLMINFGNTSRLTQRFRRIVSIFGFRSIIRENSLHFLIFFVLSNRPDSSIHSCCSKRISTHNSCRGGCSRKSNRFLVFFRAFWRSLIWVFWGKASGVVNHSENR